MKTYLLVFISLIINGLAAQNGPGGIGNTMGTGNLLLWLNAEKTSGTNNTVATTWVDNSGNGYDFNLGNGATYITNAQNGYSAFRFNGTNQYFQRAYTAALSPSGTAFTLASANKVNSSGSYKAVFSNRDDPPGTPTRGYILYSAPNSNNWQFWTGNNGTAWNQLANISTSGSWASQLLTYSAGSKTLYVNHGNSTTSSHTMTPNSTFGARVGAGVNESAPQFFFNGDIAEIIMYNKALNLPERVILNNYLAAKYNFTLSANDIFNQDNTAKGNYDHDVAGIGRLNAANQVTDAIGTGIVEILNPSNLNNGEYLIWGHNGIPLSNFVYNDLPVGVGTRLERTWRPNEVNLSGTVRNVGNIDMIFYMSSVSAFNSLGPSNVVLIVDTNNDGLFANETPIVASSAAGGTFVFSGVGAIRNNTRFTLGTVVILPILINEFEVSCSERNTALVDYNVEVDSTVQEIKFMHSVDGINYNTVASVPVTANIGQLPVQVLPNSQNYFKIAIRQQNGTETETGAKFLKCGVLQDELDVYPCPTQNLINIEGLQETAAILLLDYKGTVVDEHKYTLTQKGNNYQLDLSNCAPGVYIVRILNRSFKIIKE